MNIERVAKQRPSHWFAELHRVHPSGYPDGVDVTYGREGTKAVVQAVHLPAHWSIAKAKTFLRERGLLDNAISFQARSFGPNDCTACGKDYGWNHACGRCMVRPKKLDPALSGMKFNLAKSQEELQIAFGWFYVVERADGTKTVDFSKECSTLESIERAGYAYVLDSRKGGVMHQKSATGEIVQVGRLAEFVVVTPEKRTLWGLDGLTHKMHLGIWGGMRIDDPAIWAQVKSGALAEFSIGGWAAVHQLDN